MGRAGGLGVQLEEGLGRRESGGLPKLVSPSLAYLFLEQESQLI